MVTPVAARVEMISPTWDAPPLFSAPSISFDPAVALVRRIGRHTVVATTAMLAGVLLWVPAGFGLGVPIRLGFGIGTGIGLAVIATVISMAIPLAEQPLNDEAKAEQQQESHGDHDEQLVAAPDQPQDAHAHRGEHEQHAHGDHWASVRQLEGSAAHSA